MDSTVSNTSLRDRTQGRPTDYVRKIGKLRGRDWRRTFLGYVLAAATVAVATALRIGMDPVLGEHHPFTLYFAAVALTAWYGGFISATAAIVLSYFAADWFFITPRFEFNWPHENLDEFLALMAFLFSSFAIAITSSIMRRALARARQKTRELEEEITERERAESALQLAQSQLRHHATLLEERVQERTAHLEETVRSLQGVCYHIAHDLRAPLRAMEGFTTLLLKDHAPGLDQTGRVHLQRIGQSAHRMDLLIHGLLEYGRLGIEEFLLTRIDPKESLSRVLASLQSEIASKRAEIELSKDWPEVWANESLLELVFFNVLSNALKFVPLGKAPQVVIRNESREGMIQFWIEDNGIGIAREHLHNAFKIFQHLHPRDHYSGTGMGLALTAKAVELMRGSIGVESIVKQGSRFWFELPCAEESSEKWQAKEGKRREVLAFSL